MDNKNHTNGFDNEPLGDEFLSAYVDGELTDEQLAQVEKRLAEDPQARELVEELRALSQQVQSLPREMVGEDLRSVVMQRAERAMLLGANEPNSQATSASGTSRRWVWAAMALAASLLLTLYLPTIQQDEQPVASAKPVPKALPREQPDIEAMEQPVDHVVSGQESNEAESADSMEFAAATAVPEADLSASSAAGIGGELGQIPSDMARASESSSVMQPPAMQPRVAAAHVPADPAGELAEDVSVDDMQLACEVHITLGDGEKSVEQFNRVLLRNFIALQEGNNEIRTEDEDAFAKLSAKRRDKQKLQFKQEQDDKELVLVEGSIDQIESSLAEFNLDVFNCSTIRIVADDEQATPPIERLRQWERTEAQEPQGQSLQSAQGGRAQSQLDQNSYGRATRVEPGNFQNRVQAQRYLNNQLLRKSRTQTYSRTQAEDPTPVQVLFVLEQQTPGEPASANGPPKPAIPR